MGQACRPLQLALVLFRTLRQLEDHCQDAGTRDTATCGPTYMFRKLFIAGRLLDGLGEAFPLLLSANEVDFGKVERRLMTKGEAMFRPLADFYQQHAPPSAS